MGPRKTLAAALEAYLDENYPYWQGDSSKLPEGLTIEMHPLTEYRIIQDRETGFLIPAESGWLGKVFIPRKISLDLQPGEWRLVVITKDVKTGGFLL